MSFYQYHIGIINFIIDYYFSLYFKILFIYLFILHDRFTNSGTQCFNRKWFSKKQKSKKVSLLLMLLDFHGFSFRGHCFPTNTTGVRQRCLVGRKTRWINLFFSSSFFFLSSAFEANEKCILSLWLLIEFLTSPTSLHTTIITPTLHPLMGWKSSCSRHHLMGSLSACWRGTVPFSSASCAKTPHSLGHRPQNLLGATEGSWCWLAGWGAAWLSQSNPLECLHPVL